MRIGRFENIIKTVTNGKINGIRGKKKKKPREKDG